MTEAHDVLPDTFGVLLRRRREEAGLSQEDLAEKAGLTGKAIGALERGERLRPYPRTVLALAHALGLDETDRLAFVAATPRRQGTTITEPHPAQRPPFPLPPTPLLGREQDVTAVTNLMMRDELRLVTLSGPGGVGKTRLALEAAAALGGTFADGVVFTPLASIRDTALVVAAIAEALDLQQVGVQSLELIVQSYLRGRHVLLVLDNYEHLLGAVPQVSRLLETCPQLSVLVTSRAALRLRAEQEYPVAPLAVPDLDNGSSVDQVSASPAVRVFIQRAQAAVPSFVLTQENMGIVAAICRRLDGLPLALELAAARVKLLSPGALLDRLDHALALLGDGPVDMPERQRTMRATVAWSYDLLRPEDQALLSQLAVFAGGWTLETAETVCMVGPDAEASDVIAGLGWLLDRNLIRAQGDTGGERRFSMLETIREYAWERLEESGAAADTQRRHAHVFLALAEEAEPHLTSARRDAWLDRLERDHDNLRAALGWSLTEGGDLEVGLRLAGVLEWFWFIGGHMSEAREYIDRALESAAHRPGGLAAISISTRALALYAAGSLAWIQGDHQHGQSQLEESVDLWRQVGDRRREAYALGYLGMSMIGRGTVRQGSDACSESLSLFQNVGDRWGEAHVLNMLGHIALLGGDLEGARTYIGRGLALFGEERDLWGQARMLNVLGNVALASGDSAEADSLYGESAELCRILGSRWNLAWALSGVAGAALLAGEYQQAHLACMESLALSRDVGSMDGVAQNLAGLAAVLTAEGQAERAAQVFGAADVLTTWTSPFQAPNRYVFDGYRAMVRERLGEPSIARAWAAGEAMTVDAAVADAMAR